MIYCQWSARVHQRESTAAGAIKIDLTSHSIRPDVYTSIIFQSAMTLVSIWWERSLREGERESENTCRKTNRNIKLLSPTKSLCSVVQHIQREAGTEIAKVSSSLKRVYESLSALSLSLSLLISCCFWGFFFGSAGYVFEEGPREYAPTRVVLMLFKASNINRRH